MSKRVNPGLALAVLLVASACSDSRELTRSRAARLLAPKVEEIIFLDEVPSSFSKRRSLWEGPLFGIDFREHAKRLESLGYVTLRDESETSIVLLTLTEKGKAANPKTRVVDAKAQTETEGRIYAFPIATRELAEITGVTDAALPFGTPSDSIKEVEFSYRIVLNALGRALGTAGGLPQKLTDVGNPRSGTAYLRRYDDGWRVENARF